jgi:hypothetical protein
MEAICSSETSVGFQRTTLRYIPEDSIFHNHRCENLKSYINYKCLKINGSGNSGSSKKAEVMSNS